MLLLLVLLIIGGRALLAPSESGAMPTATVSPSPAPSSAFSPTPSAVPTTSGPPPTILVECLQGECGTVFIRIPGGDVLFDRELVAGERVAFTEERLDVVLGDSAAVRVEVNGRLRRPEGPGGRETFTVTREPEAG